MAVAALQRAERGDIEAARFIRDTRGEKPMAETAVGSLPDRPIRSMKLSQLSDAEFGGSGRYELPGKHQETRDLPAQALADGAPDGFGIAERLFLSEGSVRQHINQIYAKLHIEGGTRSKRKQLAGLLLQKT